MALALDSEAGQATLRVARLLADPLSVLPAGAATLPALFHAPEFRALAPKALAATPAGAVLSEIARATRALPERLTPEMSTALKLALAPEAQLSKAQRFLAAAIHAPRLRAALLKAEREAMAALFGADAFEFALREGAAFCHLLAQFDEGATLSGADFASHPAAKTAHRLMAACLMASQPAAGHVYALRSTGALPQDAPEPDAQTVKQALRAMARGGTA
ncbi:hypothetical protein [Phaeobacter sp. HF9A]|uniref:hypothetical protein n=1 Tax=Phaeobacter sp. HF9A TaxID=2721561 RepID=UPI001431B513|nr:hypothetical protein [Phaeobacter sp. HF9A]NIZ12009.1 hypothetical protein [Phaeobacter sp. HF9A]